MRKCLGILLLAGCGAAQATTVTYDAVQISASRWEYIYTIENDTLGQTIEEFTIWFPNVSEEYTNLEVVSSPGGWDSIVVQPDPELGRFYGDGFFDSLALSGGIAPGDTVTGFSVAFDYGYVFSEVPDYNLIYEIIDPVTFASIEDGPTVLGSITLIPLPGAILLFPSALFALGWLRKRRP